MDQSHFKVRKNLVGHSQLGSTLTDLCHLADLFERGRQPEQGDDEPNRSRRHRDGRSPIDNPTRPRKSPFDDLFGVPVVLGPKTESGTETGQEVRRGLRGQGGLLDDGVVCPRDEIGTPLFRDGLDAVPQVFLPDLADVTYFLHRTGQAVLLACKVDASPRYSVRSASSTCKLVLVLLLRTDFFHPQKDLLGRIDDDPGSKLHLGAVFFDLVETRVSTTGSSRTEDGSLSLLQGSSDTRLTVTEVDLGAEILDPLERLAVRRPGSDTGLIGSFVVGKGLSGIADSLVRRSPSRDCIYLLSLEGERRKD